jgi:DNA topoisomerase-1
VTVKGRNSVEFDYVAKGGKRLIRQLADPTVVEIVGRLRRRRGGGPELLAYRAADGTWVDVTAADVNQAIKVHCGPDSSAKDFRTWNATVLAAVALAVTGPADSAYKRKRAVVRACQEVAHYLGNTPTVARNSYIDPRVFDRFETGWTIGGALHAIGDAADFGMPAYQGEIEQAVLDLLNEDTDADGVIAADELVSELEIAS